MEERIAARLEELRQAERETEIRLSVIRTVIAELSALLSPAEVVSGEPLGEQAA